MCRLPPPLFHRTQSTGSKTLALFFFFFFFFAPRPLFHQRQSTRRERYEFNFAHHGHSFTKDKAPEEKGMNLTLLTTAVRSPKTKHKNRNAYIQLCSSQPLFHQRLSTRRERQAFNFVFGESATVVSKAPEEKRVHSTLLTTAVSSPKAKHQDRKVRIHLCSLRSLFR